MNYKKITKTQVKSIINKQGIFSGFIVGNKVNPYHFFDGWNLACNVEFKTIDDMNNKINSFLHYLDKELGDRAIFYIWNNAEV